jgi:hypothetical protein
LLSPLGGLHGRESGGRLAGHLLEAGCGPADVVEQRALLLPNRLDVALEGALPRFRLFAQCRGLLF